MTAAQEVVRLDLPASGTRALLVIDRLVCGRSFGGLRVVDALGEDELRAAARTMTLKYGFLGLPLGGAKAALELPDGADAARRAAALHEMGAALGGTLRGGAWEPAIDIGSTREDVAALHAGAGSGRDLSRWPALSERYTAWSVFAALRVALVRRGVPPAGARVAIEGYGRVGSELAALCDAAGLRIVALSTRAGAVAAPEGIDVPAAARRREQRGDTFVEGLAGTTAIDPREVLLVDAEVVVPAARAFTLHAGNHAAVRAPVVACAANAPMTRAVERALFARGVTVVPDFVANGGGVAGSVLDRYATQDAIRRLVETRFAASVAALLDASDAAGVAPVDLAERAALAWLDGAGTAAHWPSALLRRLAAATPQPLRGALVTRWARRHLWGALEPVRP